MTGRRVCKQCQLAGSRSRGTGAGAPVLTRSDGGVDSFSLF